MKPRSLWNSPAVLYTAFAAAFLTFRLILFFVGTTASEYLLYQDYGEKARDQPLAELYRERDIEYPHLAVLFGTLAGWVGDRLPETAPRWTDARPNPYYGNSFARYEAGLSVVLASVDVACLLLIYLLALRIYPAEGPQRRVGRLLLYTVGTGVLGPILYDRQDLVVALIALAALVLLVYRFTIPSYLLLVLGTAFKLVPALLLPVWVFAAATWRSGPHARFSTFSRAVVIEAGIAGALLLLWPVLTYYFGGGDRAFVFLSYHTERGLQLEAPPAWPTMLLDPDAVVVHGYGSYNFRSALGDRIAHYLKYAMLAAVAITCLIAGRGFWPAASAETKPTPATLGPHIVASAVLVWLGFILVNKVGSPQYLLWIAPLIPLLPLRGAAAWCWATLVVAVCGLTTLGYPTFYKYLKGELLPGEPGVWAGPNTWCMLLLSARSLGLLAATIWLGHTTWRSLRPLPATVSLPRSTPHDSIPAAEP